mmetsp:Transcript_26785/g.82227  ORF Transcript_26785/g.82227 Transcript_26785/m.82227 type:complete len:124 (+) Transcript_26785:344-715(+)
MMLGTRLHAWSDFGEVMQLALIATSFVLIPVLLGIKDAYEGRRLAPAQRELASANARFQGHAALFYEPLPEDGADGAERAKAVVAKMNSSLKVAEVLSFSAMWWVPTLPTTHLFFGGSGGLLL